MLCSSGAVAYLDHTVDSSPSLVVTIFDSVCPKKRTSLCAKQMNELKGTVGKFWNGSALVSSIVRA